MMRARRRDNKGNNSLSPWKPDGISTGLGKQLAAVQNLCSYPSIFFISTACQFLTISCSLLLTTNKLRFFRHAAHKHAPVTESYGASKPGIDPSKSDTVSSPVNIYEKRHDTFQSIEFDYLGCEIQPS